MPHPGDRLLKTRRDHWYKRRGLMDRGSYVAVYDDPRAMQKDIDRAARYGWVALSATGASGHLNLGRTLFVAILTGGLSVIFGRASRSKGPFTVTFHYDPYDDD